MNLLTGSLIFLNPWVLTGLAFLPVIWFLLRVTPPAPKRMLFPPARFLEDLVSREQTASKTPWWILLLRLMILALITVALARPVINPGETIPGRSAVRLVIDNGWAAGPVWSKLSASAMETAGRAARENRPIYILTTAPAPGEDAPVTFGPATGDQAAAIIRGIKPHPWPADYAEAEKLAEKQATGNSLHSVWFSAGIHTKNGDAFINTLQKQGGLDIHLPEPHELPLYIQSPEKTGQGLRAVINGPKNVTVPSDIFIEAVNENGKVIDRQNMVIRAESLPQEILFELPNTLHNKLRLLRIKGRPGAGSVLLLDDQFKRHKVGIITPAGQSQATPLIEDSYYIEKALAPYADILSGNMDEILKEEPSIIIMPNIGAMPPETLNTLEGWVKEGGLLLRFAGPNMTQGENFLVPVPLRQGGRALDGSLSWDKPLTLAPFPKNSPLHGIALPDNIEVKRQLLAEPIDTLPQKTWAALSDGTPFITAGQTGRGLLVLVHTTATPEWSDFALSGTFVQILRRITNMGASKTQRPVNTDGQLQPLIMLDGFGALQTPASFEHTIDGSDFDRTVPSSSHPPGIYGRAGLRVALNIGDRIERPVAIDTLPGSINTKYYDTHKETDLMPALLAIAFLLFLLDWLIMSVMQTSRRRFITMSGLAAARKAALLIATFTILLSTFTAPAMAQEETQPAHYADEIYLAYIKSGLPEIDQTAHKGLGVLSRVLASRTSVEPSGVVGLDPEKDVLAFFPLIYWPVTSDGQSLSPNALRNIQHYLNHGGMILVDTRDTPSSVTRGYAAGRGRNSQALQSMIGALDIPPLVPVSRKHVLGKSFYLLDSFPGRHKGGTLWVEEQSVTGRDGVSSIIIGTNDWASAWADSAGVNQRFLTGRTRDMEMALRFGVNVMMYALTGNYKNDQVHMPHILERLGQ